MGKDRQKFFESENAWSGHLLGRYTVTKEGAMPGGANFKHTVLANLNAAGLFTGLTENLTQSTQRTAKNRKELNR
jgi:hypothetical protein